MVSFQAEAGNCMYLHCLSAVGGGNDPVPIDEGATAKVFAWLPWILVEGRPDRRLVCPLA